MHPAIQIKHELERGCGRRKPGGLYLVSDKSAAGCGKMPIPFEICPCCGEGVRPSRAPRWLTQPERLWADMACSAPLDQCEDCPLFGGQDYIGAALLIWVGQKYYPSGDDFLKEAAIQGISRRIKSIPEGFQVGKTWVLLAHERAIPLPFELFADPDLPTHQPGIFSMFRPSRIEVIVTGEESDEEIESYLKRGLTPVKPVYPKGATPAPRKSKPEHNEDEWLL